MNGYPTQFCIWKEEGLLGSKAGLAWRPTGVTAVDFRLLPASTWQVLDPLHGAKADDVVHQAFEVSISREVKHSEYDALWLEAISDGVVTSADGTDTRHIIDNVEPPTFACQFLLEDGNSKKIRGMSLASLEWTLESGRVVREEATFIGLQAEALGTLPDIEAVLAPGLGGLEVQHYFKPGTAWTGGNMANDLVTAISCQLIFERDVKPCQWDAWGKATRHAYAGGWDFLGRSRVQVPTRWDQLFSTTQCLAAWRIGRPSDYILIEASVKAKLSGHPIVVQGQIDHLLDWRAVRAGRSLTTLKKYVQP